MLERLRIYDGADQAEIFGPAPAKSPFRLLLQRLRVWLGF